MITTPSRAWRPRRRKPRATSLDWSRYSFQVVACQRPSRFTRIAGRSACAPALRSRTSNTVSAMGPPRMLELYHLGFSHRSLHLLERLPHIFQAFALFALAHEV